MRNRVSVKMIVGKFSHENRLVNLMIRFWGWGDMRWLFILTQCESQHVFDEERRKRIFCKGWKFYVHFLKNINPLIIMIKRKIPLPLWLIIWWQEGMRFFFLVLCLIESLSGHLPNTDERTLSARAWNLIVDKNIEESNWISRKSTRLASDSEKIIGSQ